MAEDAIVPESPQGSPQESPETSPQETPENVPSSPIAAAEAARFAAEAAAASGSNTGGGSGIDPALLAHIISTSIATALNAQSSSSTSHTGRHIRASDLPTFKGYSLDGVDAVSFLESLETQFTLAGTPEPQKTQYASLAFPNNTPALAWFREQRDLGLFRERRDPPDVLRYEFFKSLFLQRFPTPLSRRYALEDLWDKFQQKGTVSEHHIRFTKLWQQLQQLNIKLPPDVVASKYLRSLKAELFQAVCNKNRELPDLDTIHRQAVEAEYQFKPSPSRAAPELKGIFPTTKENSNNDKRKSKDRNNGKRSETNNKFCAWHKWNPKHTTEECRTIKDLKDKGEWRGKD